MSDFSRRGILKKLLPLSFFGLVSKANSVNNTSIDQNDDMSLKEQITSVGVGRGAELIPLRQRGTVQDAIVSVFVDGFGADPTGNRDSTSAVMAAVTSINGARSSAYNDATTSYAEVVFGNGTYLIGDVPFFSGIKYRGQGKFATRIIPKSDAKFCFTTTDMSDSRLFQSGIENMTIGCGYQNKSALNYSHPPIGVGGIKIKEASYFTLNDVVCRYMDGVGLWLGNVWDSDFTNLRIMECGNFRDLHNPIPGLLIGPGDSPDDGTNAVRFYGFHIESCPQLMQIQKRTRHVFFVSSKIESHDADSIPSTILGTRGVTFDCPELTWARKDLFMFHMIRRSSDDDNQLLVFNSPTLISSLGSRGCYFKYDSRMGPLVINNAQLRGVWQLVSGRNIQITGGTSWLSGPALVSGSDSVVVQNVYWKGIVQPEHSNPPMISINGLGCSIIDNRFDFSGEKDDGFVGIYVGNKCLDSQVTNNLFEGKREVAISIDSFAAKTATIYGNRIVNLGDFSSVVHGTEQVFPLLFSGMPSNKYPVEFNSFTIQPNNKFKFGHLTSGNFILISATWKDRFFRTNVDSAMVLMNNNTDIIKITCNLIGVIKDGSSDISELGYIYLTKSGNNCLVINKLESVVEINLSSYSV
ncbi:hypothetical protein ABRZ24_05420 [Brenneria populi]|uniref:Pectate lyase superfamily protein domain-containing protein n=1 Tax=Brenneria populi TaxID=1505588 RepID=A0ABU6JN96_9GAMM|nr:hypothetical protein [Brenneria populi Li et al. 2015]